MPPLGWRPKPRDVRITMRAFEVGVVSAVRSMVGRRSLIRSAWARWFVANWIS